MQKRTSIHINDTPRGSWASSIFDLKNSQADTLLPDLLDRVVTEDIDQNNTQARTQNRNADIFSLYPPQPEVSVKVINTQSVPKTQPKVSVKVTINTQPEVSVKVINTQSVPTTARGQCQGHKYTICTHPSQRSVSRS